MSEEQEKSIVVKQVFEKVAFEGLKGREIYKWLKDELGFRLKSGKPLSLSGVYRVLNDTFYYGEFEYPKGSGNFYDGSYEPIITKELFFKAKDQLEIGVKYKDKNKVFNFTRIMKCGNCDSGITAHEKFKRLSNGEIVSYVYYNCTKAKDLDCKEKIINENDLMVQLIELIDGLKVKELEVSNTLKEEIERYNNFQSLFGNKGSSFIANKIKIKEYMKYLLREGNREEKREVLSYIKSQIYLKDKKLVTNIH